MNPKDLVGAKKAPLALVPSAGMIMSAPAHKNGADKYGPFNWRNQPVQAMTYVEAVIRHLFAWIDGQDEAEDTGINHVGHAIAGLNILADAMALGNLLDNRPAKGPAADMLREQDKSGKADTQEVKFYSSLKDTPLFVGRPEPVLFVDNTCTECGQYPEHSLMCPLYEASPADLRTWRDLGPLPKTMEEAGDYLAAMTEAFGVGDGPIYKGTPVENLDGCYEYRGKHVHPIAATPQTFRDIDREIDGMRG